jgi:hypothetical protein
MLGNLKQTKEQTLEHAPEPVASYCTRLDCLVTAALTRLRPKPS